MNDINTKTALTPFTLLFELIRGEKLVKSPFHHETFMY